MEVPCVLFLKRSEKIPLPTYWRWDSKTSVKKQKVFEVLCQCNICEFVGKVMQFLRFFQYQIWQYRKGYAKGKGNS